MFIVTFRNQCGRMVVYAANFVITITPLLWLPALFAGVNPDGSYSQNISIEVPPGRNGLQPNLSLAYNSSGGNGPIGMGWSLSFPIISRVSNGGALHYDGTDSYASSGGRLAFVADPAGGHYESQNQDWAKYYPQGSCGNSYCSWIVKTNDGKTMYFGDTADAFVTALDINGSTRTGYARAYALSKIVDQWGGIIQYSYTQHGGQIYLTQIKYNPNMGGLKWSAINFNYDTNRPDVETIFYGGRQYTQYRLNEIVVTQGLVDVWPFNLFTGDVVKRYHFSYDQSPASGRSRLTQLTVSSATQTLTQTSFKYNGSSVNLADLVPQNCTGNGLGSSLTSQGDFNGDGFEDVAAYTGQGTIWCISFGSSLGLTPQVCMQALGVDSHSAYVGDYNGDGFSDIAAYTGTSNTWCISSGSPSGLQPQFCTNGLGVSKVVVGDFNGDGLSDITSYTGNGLYWCTSYGTSWGFTSQACGSAIGVGPDTAYAGDFNGDGYTDIAAYTGNGTSWCISPGSAAGLQPQYCTSNGLGSTLATAADFNNDGFTDIAAYTGVGMAWCFAFGAPNGFIPQVCMNTLGVDSHAALLGDYNGDGKLDLAAYTNNGLTWCIAYGNGNGVNSQICTDNGVGTSNVAVLDHNGDGYSDIAAYTGMDSSWCVSRGQGYLDADKITSIANATGAIETISYSASRLTPGAYDTTADSMSRPNNSLYFMVSQIVRTSNMDLDV